MGMIAEITAKVEDICRNENNRFGYGIWSHHIVDVVEYSKKLAEIVEADVEIVEIAALLHDYASIKNYSFYKEHHLHSANEAEVILKKYDYPEDRIQIIKDCIVSHRGSVEIEKLSKEAICVADGDAIAHIVNVPSLLYFTYMKKNLSIEDGVKWVSSKLERSWKKLSPIAKDLIEDKYKSCQLMLNSSV